MILDSGLYGHIGTGPGKTRKGANIHQAQQARQWAGANVASYHETDLQKALNSLRNHPDAYSTGYSQAKVARERIEKELASRQP